MKKIIIGGLSLAAPFTIMAAGDVELILSKIKSLADSIVPLFMVVAVAVFLWGIIRFITAGGDEEKQKNAKNYIIYGLIGIFVMVAFWGIIELVAGSFDIGTSPGQIQKPGLPQ